MRITLFHSQVERTNCYLLTDEDTRTALLIDPVEFTVPMLTAIETGHFDLRTVLLTRPEPYMLHALRTIAKVYTAEVFSGSTVLGEICCTCLSDDITVERGGFSIRAIPMHSHSRESFVYAIGDYLFTGSIVHAGTLGETPSPYAEALLVSSVRDHLFPLGDHTILLPAVGPPSTIRAERRLSPYYKD